MKKYSLTWTDTPLIVLTTWLGGLEEEEEESHSSVVGCNVREG